MNKLNQGFTYEPEEDLNIDEIADRLGEEMVEYLEDLMLCPSTAIA